MIEFNCTVKDIFRRPNMIDKAVRKLADNVFAEGFERFLLENPEESKKILDKAMTASRARLAAKKARELTRRKGDLDVTNFYGKLSDCKSKDPKVSEIFIVEGDSAGGNMKLGRNNEFQAVFPLRGKMLNTQKASLEKILKNAEIGFFSCLFPCLMLYFIKI